jgi:hypothetical protein
MEEKKRKRNLIVLVLQSIVAVLDFYSFYFIGHFRIFSDERFIYFLFVNLFCVALTAAVVMTKEEQHINHMIVPIFLVIECFLGFRILRYLFMMRVALIGWMLGVGLTVYSIATYIQLKDWNEVKKQSQLNTIEQMYKRGKITALEYDDLKSAVNGTKSLRQIMLEHNSSLEDIEEMDRKLTKDNTDRLAKKNATKTIIKDAAIGSVVAGHTGAVVGAIVGKNKADQELNDKNATKNATKTIIKDAAIGGVLAGHTGAVVGAIVGENRADQETKDTDE